MSTHDEILISNVFAPKQPTEEELSMFKLVCQRTGLDPLLKQIYPVYRWNRDLKREAMQVQIGIDGYRVIAERSGCYAGQRGAFWCGEDGNWVDAWLSDTPPAAAKVGIIRTDFAEPVWGVATWRESAQKKKDGSLMAMWASKGTLMLAKTAETLAFRKAFPQVAVADMLESPFDTEPELTSPEERLEQYHALVTDTAVAECSQYLTKGGFTSDVETAARDLSERDWQALMAYARKQLAMPFGKRHAQTIVEMGFKGKDKHEAFLDFVSECCMSDVFDFQKLNLFEQQVMEKVFQNPQDYQADVDYYVHGVMREGEDMTPEERREMREGMRLLRRDTGKALHQAGVLRRDFVRVMNAILGRDEARNDVDPAWYIEQLVDTEMQKIIAAANEVATGQNSWKTGYGIKLKTFPVISEDEGTAHPPSNDMKN